MLVLHGLAAEHAFDAPQVTSEECQREIFYFEKMEVDDYRNDPLLAEACHAGRRRVLRRRRAWCAQAAGQLHMRCARNAPRSEHQACVGRGAHAG